MSEPWNEVATKDRATVPPQPSGFFSLFDVATNDAFLRCCRRIPLNPGQSLFLQGIEHTHTYVIKSGLIRTYYVSEAGREVTLGYWSSGDLVGGPNLFGGGSHIWSAAANRRSEVLAISGPDLRKFAEADTKVMRWIINVLEFKLRWLSILFQIHGTEDVQHRLAKLLLMLGDLYGEEIDGEIVIKHRISQTDLATLVGASRQWTNKALAQLRDEGFIDMQGRRISLRDPQSLHAILSTA